MSLVVIDNAAARLRFGGRAPIYCGIFGRWFNAVALPPWVVNLVRYIRIPAPAVHSFPEVNPPPGC